MSITTSTNKPNNLKRKASTAGLSINVKSAKKFRLNHSEEEKYINTISDSLKCGLCEEKEQYINNVFYFLKNGSDKKSDKESDIEMDFLIDLENVPTECIFIAICNFINEKSSKVVFYKEYFCEISGFGNDPDEFFGILDQIRNNCKGVCEISLEHAKRVDMCFISAMHYSKVPYPMDYGDYFLQDFGKHSEKNGTVFAVRYPTIFDKKCKDEKPKKPEINVIKTEDIPSYTPFTDMVYLKQINRGLFTVYLKNIYKDEINKFKKISKANYNIKFDTINKIKNSQEIINVISEKFYEQFVGEDGCENYGQNCLCRICTDYDEHVNDFMYDEMRDMYP
jgi:hypothetical protein